MKHRLRFIALGLSMLLVSAPARASGDWERQGNIKCAAALLAGTAAGLLVVSALLISMEKRGASSAAEAATRLLLKNISNELNLEWLKSGRIPDNLEGIPEGLKEQIRTQDTQSTQSTQTTQAIRYELPEIPGAPYVLQAPGPDGVFLTDDDVVYEFDFTHR